jgi:hypothetical protein
VAVPPELEAGGLNGGYEALAGPVVGGVGLDDAGGVKGGTEGEGEGELAVGLVAADWDVEGDGLITTAIGCDLQRLVTPLRPSFSAGPQPKEVVVRTTPPTITSVRRLTSTAAVAGRDTQPVSRAITPGGP